MKYAALMSFAIVLASCASTPEATHYMISTDTKTVASVDAEHGLQRVGLDAIRLPAYTLNSGITSLTSENTIFVDDKHRWAEPPEKSIQRSMARGLREALGTDVISSPYPPGLAADVRVQIRFESFIRTPAMAKIAGQYLITDGRGREVLSVESFDYSQALGSTEYSAFVKVASDSLARLASDIAGNLAATVKGSRHSSRAVKFSFKTS